MYKTTQQQEIEQRCLDIANFIVNTNSTVRNAAKKFKCSKSTVFLDVTKRIFEIDHQLGNQVQNVLQYNKEQRHFRGGLSTKQRFSKVK